jgi:glycosyltransferase involved in cell wall biosynthesis
MRILLLTPQPPYPPHAGGALRTLGLLEGLHRAGHTIDLLTFIYDSTPDPRTTPAAALCGQIVTVPMPQRSASQRLRDLVAGKTDMAQRFASTTYAEALHKLLQANHFDVVQAEGLEVADYLHQAQAEQPSAALVYSSTNAEYELQRVMFRADRTIPSRWPRALYSFIQSRRLMRFERAICRLSAVVIATSQPDALAFERLASGTPIHVVPNGIHTTEYQGNGSNLELGAAALLFTGSMSYRPNVDAVLWFAEQVLGRVRAAVPNARLYIVGQQPHPRLDPLRQRQDVQITGFVQDVSPFLHSCTVYVAPLRTGGGTRLKLLQAMAARCAIVSTSVGAMGLDITSGDQALIADDALSFAQAVIALLNDPARRAALGLAAEKLVTTTYDWDAIAPRLLAVYADPALQKRTAPLSNAR